MKLNREGRRIVAQFLNGLGVAVLATLVLAPAAVGNLYPSSAVIAVCGAAILHATALLVTQQT